MLHFRIGQSTVGGPKWTNMDLFRPKWTKMDHFGPFGLADAKNNSVQTRCIVKGEAQKSPLFWRFSGGFWFSQDRLLSRNSTRKPLNLIKSPIFTNTPCKSTCLYNAPSMHTVNKIQFGIRPFWPKWSFGPFWTILVQYTFWQYCGHSLSFSMKNTQN